MELKDNFKCNPVHCKYYETSRCNESCNAYGECRMCYWNGVVGDEFYCDECKFNVEKGE